MFVKKVSSHMFGLGVSILPLSTIFARVVGSLYVINKNLKKMKTSLSNLNTIRIIIIIVSGIFGGFFSKFFPLSRKAVWPTCEFLNNYICYQYNGMVLIAQHGKFNINPQFYILERD
jgi:hypothetical protein